MIDEISASILAANPLEIKKSIESIVSIGLDSLHIDIMDLNYVDNLALNFDLIKAIEQTFPRLNLDIHLMVTNVEKALHCLAGTHPRSISFHPKTVRNHKKIIQKIQSHTAAGIVINPDERAEDFFDLLPLVDVCTIMSVTPGRCGQAFQQTALCSLQKIHHHLQSQGQQCRLSIDGGINLNTLPLIQDQKMPLQAIIGSGLLKNIHDTDAVKKILSFAN